MHYILNAEKKSDDRRRRRTQTQHIHDFQGKTKIDFCNDFVDYV